MGYENKIQKFDSMASFYKYICDTPFNDAFRWCKHSSVDGDRYFCQTSSFEEAVELLKHGWESKAQQLTQKLKAQPSTEVQRQMQTVLSVAGFQPIVPLYLCGIPTNMVSKQFCPVKQKVLTVVKSINYNGGTSTETITEESIKALQIVQKLEQQGYRVNLDIALGTSADSKNVIAQVRIKQAGQKLNIKQVAFPMVHPSMLRRLMFRYIEVCPDVTKGWCYGYGRPIGYQTMKEQLGGKGTIVLPAVFDKPIESYIDIDMAKMDATV